MAQSKQTKYRILQPTAKGFEVRNRPVWYMNRGGRTQQFVRNFTDTTDAYLSSMGRRDETR